MDKEKEPFETASPLPWEVEADDSERWYIKDAEGIVLGEFWGRREDAEMVCAAACHYRALLKDKKEIETAAREAARQQAAGEVEELRETIHRLRKLVGKMLPLVRLAYQVQEDLGAGIKGLCALKGVDASIVDKAESRTQEIIADACAEGIAEEEP